MQRTNLVVTTFVIALCNLAYGQDAESISMTYVFKPKSGHSIMFEGAMKEHIQWAKDSDETWNWATFAITTGERLGSYLVVSHEHTWKDFDKHQSQQLKSSVHWRSHVSEHVESGEGSIYRYVVEQSRDKGVERPSPMATLVTYHVRPFAKQRFLQQLAKLTTAMRKQKEAPPVLIYELLNGGGDKVVLAYPLKKWSDVPKIETAIKAMTQELGEDFEEILEELDELTEEKQSEMIAFLPELSLNQ